MIYRYNGVSMTGRTEEKRPPMTKQYVEQLRLEWRLADPKKVVKKLLHTCPLTERELAYMRYTIAMMRMKEQIKEQKDEQKQAQEAAKVEVPVAIEATPTGENWWMLFTSIERAAQLLKVPKVSIEQSLQDGIPRKGFEFRIGCGHNTERWAVLVTDCITGEQRAYHSLQDAVAWTGETFNSASQAMHSKCQTKHHFKYCRINEF